MYMPPRKSSKDSATSTRDNILSVATRLFNDLGYENTSIPMICKEAGVSKTTLHYYFPKKQDLFFDMNNYFQDQFNSNFHRVVEQETFTGQIWEIFKIMCEGDYYYGVSISRQYFAQRLREHSERGFIQNIYHRKMLIAVIRSAQHAGQMLNMSPPDRICEALSYAMRGVILTWAIEDDSFNLTDCGKEVVRTIIMPADGYDI